MPNRIRIAMNDTLPLSLFGGVLRAGGAAVLSGLDAAFSLRGGFLRLDDVAAAPPSSHLRRGSRAASAPWRHDALGRAERVVAFAGQVQGSPFWFTPVQGSDPGRLDGAAAWLLLKRSDGLFVFLAPLPSGNASSYLVGAGDGALRLYRATGNDRLAPSGGGRVLYVAACDDPWALLSTAACAVSRALPAAALREDKPPPAFADRLGWCTWNAFYLDVSASKIEEGLAAFRRAGVRPGFVVVDDGWQRQTPPAPGVRRRLAAFGADEAKFPGGLAPVVRTAKRHFGLRHVLAWLTPHGLPGGIDPAAFRRYRPAAVPPQRDAHVPLEPVLRPADARTTVLPGDWRGFLGDRFAELRRAGVDGVKADFQGTLFFASARSASTSRPREIARMRSALEAAAADAGFGANVITCMAHLPEIWYHARQCNLSRGSDDFFPDIPASHGAHIRANAFTGLWFGRFMGVDWDMFQSAHPFGDYHAAARAVSGGPVYTADTPGGVDAAVLRRVAFPDGRVPRFPQPATPALRSLFPEAGDDPRAFVVVNANACAGCAALFDAATGEPLRAVRATIRPSDIPGVPDAERYAVWNGRGTPRLVAPDGAVVLSSGRRRFSVVTVAPVRDGRFAAFGLAGLHAPAAALESVRPVRGGYAVRLSGGGRFAAWCASPPKRVLAGRREIPFSHDTRTGLLFADVTTRTLTVRLFPPVST